MKGCLLFVLLLVSSVISDAKDTKACTVNDFAFGGGNILVSGSHNLQDNWEACQASCQAITNCHFWTWFKPDYSGSGKKFCELKFEDGGIPLEGAISGPRNC